MRPRLLIADEDVLVPSICRTFFQASSIDVTAVRTVSDCLLALDAFLPNLVVLDEDFSNNRARGAILATLRDDGQSPIPVVLIGRNVSRTLEMPPPIVSTLCKPFHLRQLRDVVVGILGLSSWSHVRGSAMKHDSWELKEGFGSSAVAACSPGAATATV